MNRHNLLRFVQIFTAITILWSCARASFKIAGEKAVIGPEGQDLIGQLGSPKVTIRANGSEQDITVPVQTEVDIEWVSKGTTECAVGKKDQTIGSGVSGSAKTMITESSEIIVICQTSSGPIADRISIGIQSNDGSKDSQPTLPTGTDTQKSTALRAQLKLNGFEQSIEVTYGTNVEVSWASFGAVSCALEPNNIEKTEGTIFLEKLKENTNVTLTCRNSIDVVKVQRSIVVTPPGPPIVDLKINGSQGPVVAPLGTLLKVSWISVLADKCTLSVTGAPIMAVAVQGEIERSALSEITSYQIRCDGVGGSSTDTVLVIPNTLPPEVKIMAQGQRSLVEVPFDSMVKLEWTSKNATRCFITPGTLNGITGTADVGPVKAVVQYTALCEGPNGLATDSVIVAPKNGKLELSLLVNGTSNEITVSKNATVKVSWTSLNATSCSVSPLGFEGLNGNDRLSQPLSQTIRVTLTCLDLSNVSQSKSILVNVIDPSVPPTNLPKVNLKVNGSDGPLYVDVPKVVQAVWVTENVTDCKLNLNPVTNTGSGNVTITQDTKMTLTCKSNMKDYTDEVVILARKQGVAACKVGINIKDGGQWGNVYDPVLGSKNPGCFHGVAICATNGHFKVYGQEVQALADQKVGFRITKLSTCEHNVVIYIKNPDTFSAAYQSSYKDLFYLQMKKGQTIEAALTNSKLCNDIKTRSSLDPLWSSVTPNQCLR